MKSTDKHSDPGFNEKLFQLADKDKTGFLSKAELAYVLHPPHKSELEKLIIQHSFDDLDTDKDGKISIDEYYGIFFQKLTLGNDTEITEEDREHFKKSLDKNGDGFINRDEYQAMHLANEDSHIDSWVIDMFVKADTNKDGKIDKKEFQRGFVAILHEAFELPDYDEDDAEEDYDDHVDL
ncbi:hypothetical protein HZS_6653 [Henneguya salminicola]|nr:hypothetical protein HZS_6653 [Henneguya salminicola]